MKTPFPLTLSLVMLTCLTGGAFGGETTAPGDSKEAGPRLAAQIVHSTDKDSRMVTGNGDISLMWFGSPANGELAFGKADFWGVVRGNITTAGHLHLTCDELKGAPYSVQQNLGPATITSKAGKRGFELATTVWIAYPENLVVTELKNTGTGPLHCRTELVNGMSLPMAPVCRGFTADSTWLQVTPDLVEFQVGNRSFEKEFNGGSVVRASFVGSIADVKIASPEYPEPFFAWTPNDPDVQNIGKIQVGPDAGHGKAAQFKGEADHRLIMRSGCIPQTAFTFSAWINPSLHTPDATVFAGIARETPKKHPYFRGFLVHLVDGKPEVRLNYFTAASATVVPLNQWSEIKAVYEKQLLTLYVNGVQVAQGDNPPASAQMGWDKTVLRTGDPALPFKGCAPQAILSQRIAGTTPTVNGQQISFTIEPGKTVKLLVSLVSDRNTSDYRNKAKSLADSSEADLLKLREAHDRWWCDFWAKSFIEIPNKRIMESWYGSLYLLACCSRGDCPPPGLWYNFHREMNSGWDGDYTLNYNYQAPFWAAYASGHFELADNYEPLLLDHMSRGRSIAENAWRLHPSFQPFSLEKYVAQRTATQPNPNTASYKGIYLYAHLIPLPGWSNDYGTFWGQKSTALFCSVNMVQRWRLARDLAYARKAYPFLKATAEFWDSYLVLKDGRYSSLKDAVHEGSGDNTNPATTISFLKLLYPSLIEISARLNVDADQRDKWQETLDKLSPFTYITASSLDLLKQAPPEAIKDKQVIRTCESGPDFPKSAYFTYKNRKITNSSAGMSCVQTIFPGWSFGLESPDMERNAALNTVTFAAQWYDYNNNCNFYASAAAIGYDPREILANLDGLLETYEKSDFTINTAGGLTENVAIVPGTLHNMFLQSYQTNIHIFPNWPKDMDATFGDLPACGGFLVSSRQANGKIDYVKITSRAGEMCHLANPWPGRNVMLTRNSKNAETFTGDRLKFETTLAETISLTPQ
ncbi:MAG: LamG-like jellyroll fold domain-containing protein [bacterium]